MISRPSSTGTTNRKRTGDRRVAQKNTTPRRTPLRPKPAWNEYLTDNQQYKLPHHQQLLKQSQHLSKAHFQKSTSVKPPRRQSTPHTMSFSRIEEGAKSLSAIGMDKKMPPSNMPRDPIQGELSFLEHLVDDLTIETDQLEGRLATQASMNGSDTSSIANTCEQKDSLIADQLEGVDMKKQVSNPPQHLCEQVELELTKRVQNLTNEIHEERMHRRAYEMQTKLLLDEQNRKADAKYCELEMQYDSVVLELDGMREALIATEEAVHRLTEELRTFRQTNRNGALDNSDANTHTRRHPHSKSTSPYHYHRSHEQSPLKYESVDKENDNCRNLQWMR